MNQALPLSRGLQIRRPRQKRSQERFESILDAAERVLHQYSPDEVSVYTVAEEAGMSPPSIYHFFPDGQHIFVALAERYFAMFAEGLERLPRQTISTWQELVDFRYASSRRFYNANSAARKIILGAGNFWAIRTRDLDLDETLAVRQAKEMQTLFVMPDMPGLVDRMTETIVMNDALWALAVHRHGMIDDESETHARRARIAHMRTYLPELLVRSPTVAHGSGDPPA